MRFCSLDEWKVAVSEGAYAGAGGLRKEAFERLEILLPAIEQEFQAEDARRLGGGGAVGKLYVDADWGRVFATALAKDVAKAVAANAQAA